MSLRLKGHCLSYIMNSGFSSLRRMHMVSGTAKHSMAGPSNQYKMQ